jgi:hypothetical protein
MPASPDAIPSDLTLEIGEELSPDEFLAAIRAFLEYVKEVSATVASESEPMQWTVHVKEGSNLVAAVPSPSTPPALVQRVYARTANAVEALARGQIDGAELPEAALNHLRAMSEFSAPKLRRRELRLWVERRPVEIDGSIGRTIAEDWRAAYSDFGVVEGRLQAIQDRGKLEIEVRDAALGQTIGCIFPEELLPRVFELFRKRIEVSGIVHYRRNGTAVSIEVSDIQRLPDDSELPSASEVRGILGAA